MNKTICPICHRELAQPLRPDFLLCPDCRVAVRKPETIPHTTDRVAVYNPEWVDAHYRNPLAQMIARRTASIVRSIVKPRGLVTTLDIGCGSGLLVDRLFRMGYLAYGVDWSEDAVKFAWGHSRGIYVHGNMETAEPLPVAQTFDVITASHILEHLAEPGDLLDTVHGSLKPGGRLVIAVPNLDWYDPDSVYRSVSTIFDPEHVIGYSPTGLVKVLGKFGWETERVITRTHGTSILTAVGVNVHRKLFGKGRDTVVKSGYVKVVSDRVLAKVLAWGMTPMNRLSERRLRGMELIAVARKETPTSDRQVY